MVNYLAFGPDGLLYMTAPGAGVIDIFDPASGEIVLTSSGPVDTPLQQPTGIAVTPDGEVLVTDHGIHDVVRFRPEIPADTPGGTPVASPGATPTGTEVESTPEPVG
jgi:streptogramin lyase